MDAMLQVRVKKMLDSQEGTQVINCYRGQKVQGRKLCLMVYFSDVISAKMTKISFWQTKGVFFSAKISKICLQACLRGVFFCKNRVYCILHIFFLRSVNRFYKFSNNRNCRYFLIFIQVPKLSYFKAWGYILTP